MLALFALGLVCLGTAMRVPVGGASMSAGCRAVLVSEEFPFKGVVSQEGVVPQLGDVSVVALGMQDAQIRVDGIRVPYINDVVIRGTEVGTAWLSHTTNLRGDVTGSIVFTLLNRKFDKENMVYDAVFQVGPLAYDDMSTRSIQYALQTTLDEFRDTITSQMTSCTIAALTNTDTGLFNILASDPQVRAALQSLDAASALK